LDEEDIKERFVEAFNEVYGNKEMVLADLQVVWETLVDFTEIDAQIDAATQEVAVLIELTQRCVTENSQTALDQITYAARYAELEQRYITAKEKVDTLLQAKKERQQEADVLEAFMIQLAERDGVLKEFDEKLWLVSIDKVMVSPERKLVFHFFGGVKICE